MINPEEVKGSMKEEWAGNFSPCYQEWGSLSPEGYTGITFKYYGRIEHHDTEARIVVRIAYPPNPETLDTIMDRAYFGSGLLAHFNPIKGTEVVERRESSGIWAADRRVPKGVSIEFAVPMPTPQSLRELWQKLHSAIEVVQRRLEEGQGRLGEVSSPEAVPSSA